MPNVLLESLACGTPVVATAVGGTVEIVAAPEAGRLVHARSAEALAAACRELLASPPDRIATRRYAERFGWQEPVTALIGVFERVVGGTRGASGATDGRTH
jgi:glycosyltransferase involved in cell wall biosynthesis